AGQQIPKGHSQRVDIGPRVNRHLPSTGELLWTGKSRRAEKARLSLLRSRLYLSSHYFRYSIVDELYPERLARIGFQHQVRWLDVAMHHTAYFRSSQCERSLLNYLQGESERHRPITTNTGFECFPLDQLHRIETLAIPLSVKSHPRNIRMMNVRSGARFAQKTR